MSRTRLVERVGGVDIVGAARARGWRHRFNKQGRDGTGKGNIEPGDEHVWGVLYRMAATQLDVLDGFEGGYRRCEIAVEIPGERVTALSYLGLSPGASLRPAHWYLDHYRIGIREHGLPEAWLAEVERHASLGE